MKTPEELNAIKEEFETLNAKLAELDEKELEQVTGGFALNNVDKVLESQYDNSFLVGLCP